MGAGTGAGKVAPVAGRPAERLAASQRPLLLRLQIVRANVDRARREVAGAFWRHLPTLPDMAPLAAASLRAAVGTDSEHFFTARQLAT